MKTSARACYSFDTEAADKFSVADLPAFFEGIGHKAPRRTVEGYYRRGVAGIRLPTFRIGNVRYTTPDAVRWWIAATNRSDEPAQLAGPDGTTAAERAALQRAGLA